MRLLVGTITAYEHRGWLRVVMVANTAEVLGIDLDADAAWEFLWELELALTLALTCYRSTLVGADPDRTCAKCSARSSQRYGDRRSGHRSGYWTGRPRHRSGICQYGEGRRSSHGRSGKGRWNDSGKDRQRRVVHRYTRLCLLGASRLSAAHL